MAPALIWGSVVIVMIAAGVYARAPSPPRGGTGRMLPRVPAPPPDVPALLYFLGVGSVTWYAISLGLPLMLWGARRIDAERHGRLRTVLVLFAALSALVAVTTIAQYFVVYGGAHGPGINAFLPVGLQQNLLPWIALAGVVAAIEARRRSLHSVVERERLRAQVAEQRLIALSGQLQPHFLFNTLQSISTLIHRDAEAADEMLVKLSDLLRDLLRHRDRLLVPLEDELRYARTYLEIAQVRFAERLRFELEVSPGLNASVPLFILQPLVENALAHGIGGRMRGGRVTLKAWRNGDRLHMEVADDGSGLPAGAHLREGIGLSNTRERLRAAFGADQSLSLEPAVGGGVVARIDIPYRVHTVASESR